MAARSYLRGHPVVFMHGQWLYADTKTPTMGNPRNCGSCGKANTKEGHDGCLGTLPDVMNACCGHGQDSEAYVQFWNGTILCGALACDWIVRNIKG